MRNNTQTAVTNMTIKRMLENKNSFNLTFRMFRHTSSEVTVKNRGNKSIYLRKVNNYKNNDRS